MSDLVGNAEDRFSHDTAQFVLTIIFMCINIINDFMLLHVIASVMCVCVISMAGAK